MSAARKLKLAPSKSLKLRGVELSDGDLHSLKTWAASKKLKLEDAAAELLAFALIEHRSRTRGDNTRSQLMGEQSSKNLAPRIYQSLREVWSKEVPWLHVDYSTGKVTTADANPGGRKGHVFLDVRPDTRAEWCDMADVLTLESVLARLIGSARPLGVRK